MVENKKHLAESGVKGTDPLLAHVHRGKNCWGLAGREGERGRGRGDVELNVTSGM